MFLKSRANTIEAVSILRTLSHKSMIFALSKSSKSLGENHPSGQITPHQSFFLNLVNSQYGTQLIFAIITFFQLTKFFNSVSDFKNFISGSCIHRDCSTASCEILFKRSAFLSFR
jgi:hypothetical protein